jgi:hypothetical protein
MTVSDSNVDIVTSSQDIDACGADTLNARLAIYHPVPVPEYRSERVEQDWHDPEALSNEQSFSLLHRAQALGDPQNTIAVPPLGSIDRCGMRHEQRHAPRQARTQLGFGRLHR